MDERIGSAKALTKRKYRNLVERAQNASESSGQASRRMTLEFAESMNIQRAIVYEEARPLDQTRRSLGQHR